MEAKKSTGPIIGIIVVVALVIIGALYLWGGKLSGSAMTEGESTVSPVSSSDDLDSLQSDLQTKDTPPDLSGL
ncbi:MAG TPA: hypothetical protein VHD69_02940 [Candidatus Paceibacterota bacterium]|jgi:hypothetical protein|nr:hypothetical protein [Candidatus Paceibacterota bacterium]